MSREEDKLNYSLFRPIELEDSELIVYNEENIDQSISDFNKIISKIK